MDNEDDDNFFCAVVDDVENELDYQSVITTPENENSGLFPVGENLASSLTLKSQGLPWKRSDTRAGNVPGPLILRVGFFDGTTTMRNAVMELISVWHQHGTANLVFERADVDKADIRIVFQTTFDRSAVGLDALSIPPSEPTMWLAQVKKDGGKRTNATKAAVRHEFGHALGLQHEHQHPGQVFDWDEDAIVDFMNTHSPTWGNCHLSDGNCRRSVRKFITEPYAASETGIGTSDEYDEASIMVYPVRRDWHKGNFKVKQPSVLSELDRHAARQLYP